MKRKLKGHRLDSIEAVQAATTKARNSIPETDFQRAFDECSRAELSVSIQEECISRYILNGPCMIRFRPELFTIVSFRENGSKETLYSESNVTENLLAN